MNSQTISNKSQNFYKLDYLCYNKIKSIPRKNIIPKKSLNNLDLSHYNNSIEIDKKINGKIKRRSQQKPILSERIKRNFSNGNKNENNYSGMLLDKNSIYKIDINNTDMNSFQNMLGLTNVSLSSSSYRKKKNAKINNIFDKNIIINNNNFDKKIIFLGEKDYDFNKDNKNMKLAQSNKEIFPYDNDSEKIDSKNILDNWQTQNLYYQYSKRKNKTNLSLNLSDSSSNNYNFKSLKNLNNSKNKNIIKENETLKAELNKFLKENMNLKIKMSTLQNIALTNEINNSNNKIIMENKKRKNLSFKKNMNNLNNDNIEEDLDSKRNIETNKIKRIKIKDDKEGKNNHTFNSIYDSMKFKIQKRKFSCNTKINNNNNNILSNKINNLNNINFNNINLKDKDVNYNKLPLSKKIFSKINDSNLEISKSKENLQKYSNSNIKYNESEVNDKNYNNDFSEVNMLKDEIIKLKKENEKLKISNEDNKEIQKFSLLRYNIPRNQNQNSENKQLMEKINILSKEIEKMKNIKAKYSLLTKDNVELQQKYNSLYSISETMQKKNEIYLNGIEEQQKKIKEKDNIIKALQNDINNIYKKNEEELRNKLNHATEQNKILATKLEKIESEIQKLRKENDELYKFKSNYSDNEIETIELQNKIKKYENINNKYESLKYKYDELNKKINELKEYEINYKIMNKEYNKLKNIENKYNDIYNKYNELQYENNNLKDIKTKYDELVLQNNKLNDIKMKYDKINFEYIKLKEIREKYHEMLKEQKNLIIIENKYNDLIQEIQELREIKIKYENLLVNQSQNIKISKETNKEVLKSKNLTISSDNFFILNNNGNNSDININNSQNIILSRNDSSNFYFSFNNGQTNIKSLNENIKKEFFITDENKDKEKE